MRWVKGALLDVEVEVIGVPVELHHTNLDERIIPMRPDLCEIEGMIGDLLRVFFGHHLHIERPARTISSLDCLKEIALMTLAIFPDKRLRLFIGKVLDSLLRSEMEFDPEALVIVVDKGEGMRAKAVHMAIARGDAPFAHRNRDLMKALRKARPKIPIIRCAS